MFDVEVTTEVWKDGRLWWDGGTMRWFGVDDEVTGWLAGSCKSTAFWLIGLPESTTGGHSIRYRTRVTQGEKVITDTTMIEFPDITYADVIRFQRWALTELSEMVDLFERKHTQAPEMTRRRGWLRGIWQLVRPA